MSPLKLAFIVLLVFAIIYCSASWTPWFVLLLVFLVLVLLLPRRPSDGYR